MKFAVSGYSFGHYLTESEEGFKSVIDRTAEMGFDGIEFSGFPHDLGLAKEIGAYAREKALEVVNMAVGADFLNDYDGSIAGLRTMIDITEALGCRQLRHDLSGRGFADGRTTLRSYDCAIPTLAKGAKEITEYAKEKGIRTMTENHGFFSQDAARVEKLINTVGDPNFGALVDIGNFLCADEDPTYSVGVMAPYAFHVHAKDFFVKSGCDVNPGEGWFCSRAGNYLRGAIIGHGDAKVAQSIKVLKNSGYDGYLSIEFEGMEDNLLGIRVGLSNLRRFVEM